MSKDSEFARNLAKQMEEGYGRHNSNLSFRHQRGERSVVHEYGGIPYVLYEVAEVNQARVIGRIANNAIRERWEDCSVGDAVPEELFDYRNRLLTMDTHNFVELLIPRVAFNGECIRPHGKRTFERVGMEMIDIHGDREMEYLWKRIS